MFLKHGRWLGAALAFAAAACGQSGNPAPVEHADTPQAFNDCSGADWCPEMVALPGGAFTMGSPATEAGREANESAPHEVTVSPFALSKTEITFSQWDACVAHGGCATNRTPSDMGWGRGANPVINVSYDDAIEYVTWLSHETGHTYRLLTEAEWEYAARAGSTTAYPWGAEAERRYVNYGADACCGPAAVGDDRWLNTAPAGSFPANAFGLQDMNGNVWEWVSDCYPAPPASGAACTQRTYRGGAWGGTPAAVRSAARYGDAPTLRDEYLGFRVARER